MLGLKEGTTVTGMDYNFMSYLISCALKASLQTEATPTQYHPGHGPPIHTAPAGVLYILLSFLLCTGHGDKYLRCIEEHSDTFIQLEGWFTASGQTRVTVVGPLRAKQWLVDMIWSMCNQEAYHRARGRCPWLKWGWRGVD